MPTKLTTKLYFLLLILNIVVSFLLSPILDALLTTTQSATATWSYILIILITLIWPLLSAAISLMLLKYWASTCTASHLPQFNPNLESTNAEVLGDGLMVLVAFLHMLLMLSRILAYISGKCRLFFITAGPTICVSMCWESIGVWSILLSVLVFSQCLLACSVDITHWGYFYFLYQFVVFFLKATPVTIGGFINLFDAIRSSLVHFQTNWGSSGGQEQRQVNTARH
ncbi:hypothetical protein BT96DRAFT_518364 [Gymnopus androsaceus JB14]|uniref:Uncharacterized protein n=1 Tax=Gymnopus androsaceus JB14 TaxID=1447944 RepID=A0A6A4I2F0_9AGAR|nr:hypothetical protein BT96DRAFT_518364 [Gymnopus androsaceus JB14]